MNFVIHLRYQNLRKCHTIVAAINHSPASNTSLGNLSLAAEKCPEASNTFYWPSSCNTGADPVLYYLLKMCAADFLNFWLISNNVSFDSDLW